MRIVFMGTPDIAVPSLEALHAEHEIALVVTQPDKPVGRNRQLTPPPVKARALELGLPVSQPTRARDAEFLEELRAARPECMAVVAYGQILPQSVLDLPLEFRAGSGCINLHFSLLPRWRGAAPVQYAVLAGDAQTGITTQWMAFKLDAGDILLQEPVPILPEETSGELLQRLAAPGAQMLAQSLRLVAAGAAPRAPQDEDGITLAPQFTREDGRINWEGSATQIHNQVRGLNPWPGAWCQWRGEPLKLWRVLPLSSIAHNTFVSDEGSTTNTEKPLSGDSVDGYQTELLQEPPGTLLARGKRLLVVTGAGVVELLEVQAPGKGRLSAQDWARGARLPEREHLQ